MQEFAENAQYLSALSAISVEPLQICLAELRAAPPPPLGARKPALPLASGIGSFTSASATGATALAHHESVNAVLDEPMGETLFRFHLRQTHALEYLVFLREVEVLLHTRYLVQPRN